MEITTGNILLIGSALLILSILASKTAGRAGISVLLLFLGVGMLAGSDGIGKISFDDPGFAQFLGVISLTYILFSGGLDTKCGSWDHITCTDLDDGHELHAWLEVYLPGAGWIGLDPSLGLLTDHHYIPLATHPEPRQTLPVQGPFAGTATDKLHTRVDLDLQKN